MRLFLLYILTRAVLPGSLAGAQSPKPAASRAPYWFKMYSLVPYKEDWTVSLRVPDLEKDLPQVLKALDKAGASLTQPLANFPSSRSDKSQQLSCRLPIGSAKKLLKSLKKLGAVDEPLTRPMGEPIALSEVQDKLRRLAAERRAHAKELAAMPDIGAAIDEIFSHLALVEAVGAKTETEVLLNMTVRQSR